MTARSQYGDSIGRFREDYPQFAVTPAEGTGYAARHKDRRAYPRGRHYTAPTLDELAALLKSDGWAPEIKMRNMVIRGTIRFADGTTRTETVDIGHYMSQETLDALRDAYVAGDDEQVDAVIDRCLTEEYMPGNGPVELIDVESLTFPD